MTEHLEHMEHRIARLAAEILADVLENPPGRLERAWLRAFIVATFPLRRFRSWRYWRTAPVGEIENRAKLRRSQMQRLVDLDAPAFILVKQAEMIEQAESACARRSA